MRRSAWSCSILVLVDSANIDFHAEGLFVGGWDHVSSGDADREQPPPPEHHARIGMVLFVVYLVLYGGFVFISAFSPAWMAQRPWADINLAIWYGFGLIGAALFLALIYSWLCRDRDAS